MATARTTIGVLTAVAAFTLLDGTERTQAAFSGANGKIGFIDVGPSGLRELFTVDPDGTNLAVIPNTTYANQFSWSPDGTKIAMARFAEGGGNHDEIFVMKVDGTEPTRLTFFDGTDQEPHWSPDGSRIVWQRQCDIWVMNVDGTDQRNLTQTGGHCAPLEAQEFHPRWSPDGTRISFESYRTGNLDIFTMTPDGEDVVSLTHRSRNDTEANWSPNGREIAFFGEGSRAGFIYVMNADGSNKRMLATPGVAPTWSPDGSRIAFVNGGLFTMNPDGSDVKFITAMDTRDIDWQPVPPLAPFPGLAVTDLSAPPAFIAAGSSFSVDDTVLNKGNAAAGSFTIGYYLSTDSIKSAADITLKGTRTVLGLLPGSGVNGTTSVRIPPSTLDGPYFLLACADIFDDVFEINEADNCLAASQMVVIGKPDLEQVAVNDPPPVVNRGWKMSINDTVQNISVLVAAPPSTTRFYLSFDSSRDGTDVVLTGKRGIESLPPGVSSSGTTNVTVPISAPSGTYFLLSCADAPQKVKETDENNNCRASATKVLIQ
jgi:hypothetical protein